MGGGRFEAIERNGRAIGQQFGRARQVGRVWMSKFMHEAHRCFKPSAMLRCEICFSSRIFLLIDLLFAVSNISRGAFPSSQNSSPASVLVTTTIPPRPLYQRGMVSLASAADRTHHDNRTTLDLIVFEE